MKSDTKYKIIEKCAPYVPPKEIEELFGIKYQTIYHYADKHQIPKWRASYAERKAEAMKMFQDNENSQKQLCILEGKKIQNGND
jgi:hypothetical protein